MRCDICKHNIGCLLADLGTPRDPCRSWRSVWGDGSLDMPAQTTDFENELMDEP